MCKSYCVCVCVFTSSYIVCVCVCVRERERPFCVLLDGKHDAGGQLWAHEINPLLQNRPCPLLQPSTQLLWYVCVVCVGGMLKREDNVSRLYMCLCNMCCVCVCMCVIVIVVASIYVLGSRTPLHSCYFPCLFKLCRGVREPKTCVCVV